MSFLLAPIGTRTTRASDVTDVVEFHLYERRAFWSNVRHARWAKGSRVVAKIVGASVVALTGTLDCLQPEYDPLIVADQRWDWRYDMLWDDHPPRVVLASELGAPFDRPLRSVKTISHEDFQRAYRALHGYDAPRQVDETL